VRGDDSTDTAAAIEADITNTLATLFSADPTLIIVSAVFIADRRLESAERRLAAGVFQCNIEVITEESSTTFINDNDWPNGTVPSNVSDVFTSDNWTLISFDTPTVQQWTLTQTATTSATPDTPAPTQAPVRVAEPAAATPAAAASSSTTVIILAGVGLLLLFVAVLVPTLCRRRLRALLGLKANNNNAAAPSNAPVDTESPSEKKANVHHWDVDTAKGTEEAAQYEEKIDMI
jgi:hypothetical protein